MPLVLDLVALARGDRHLLDTLLLTSIAQANMAVISRLEVAYARIDSPPPDELRRPVSVNALASSLRLPFETVRRRVRNLCDQDLCRKVAGGVIVPQTVLTSPEYLTNVSAAYERLQAFHYELRDRNLLTELPAPAVALDAGELPVRIVTRLTSEYVLRVLDGLTTLAGGPLNGLVLLGVFRGNVEHLGPDSPERRAQTPGQALPDQVRRPVRLAAVATRVGLPAETVRRRMADLGQRGLVAKVADGLVVPGEVLASAPVVQFVRNNIADLQRLLAGLSQLGVLACWDGLKPPPGVAEQFPQNG